MLQTCCGETGAETPKSYYLNVFLMYLGGEGQATLPSTTSGTCYVCVVECKGMN